MKRFVLRLACFTAIVVTVIGGVCLAEISAEISAYRREMAAPDGATTLFCNDSQTEQAVDPSVCPQFFNFSSSGRTLDQAYLTMIDALDAPANRGRIRRVVFDVSPASLVRLAERPVGDLDFSGRYYLVHLIHPRAAREFRRFDGWVRTMRDNLVGRRLRHFWRAVRGKVVFKSSLGGGFQAKSEVGMDAPEAFAGSVAFKARQFDGCGAVQEGDFAYRILEKVVEGAKVRGVELVFVTTPWHPDLIRACGEEAMDAFERRLAAFASRHRCRYVSFLRAAFHDSAWMDANHLNAEGAKIFTRLLAKEIGE